MSVQSVAANQADIPHASAARARAYGNGGRAQEPAAADIKPLRIKHPVRLRSGPDVAAEKAANARAEASGHPPGFVMPSGATYFASGPTATTAKPAPGQQSDQAHQPHLNHG